MERWSGRVAIVTGASAGIGKSIAITLAENGLKVVAVARRGDLLQEVTKPARKGEIHGIECDVKKEEDIIACVKWTREKLGGADILINNAGVYQIAPLTGLRADVLRNMFDVNVIGLSIFTREVIKDMQDRKVNDGHIIHIGSSLGHRIVDRQGVHPYCASKHAVRVLTEGLRRELRDLGTKIKVTEISPGLVRTDILVANKVVDAEGAEKYFNLNPCLEPEDVSNAVLYTLGTPPHVQVHEMIINPTCAP